MKMLDAGHRYELDQFDGSSEHTILQFVKRCDPPENYPGNVGAYPGTIMQDVLRALIDRIEYVSGQQHWLENRPVRWCLHAALWLLEFRAHRHRGHILMVTPWSVAAMPTCTECGHVACDKHVL